eukprot:m.27674 g.27674  ORF g.27674 m.27674 type:complete len:455 (+) comp4805_c0_seq1:454-1818(+)
MPARRSAGSITRAPSPLVASAGASSMQRASPCTATRRSSTTPWHALSLMASAESFRRASLRQKPPTSGSSPSSARTRRFASPARRRLRATAGSTPRRTPLNSYRCRRPLLACSWRSCARPPMTRRPFSHGTPSSASTLRRSSRRCFRFTTAMHAWTLRRHTGPLSRRRWPSLCPLRPRARRCATATSTIQTTLRRASSARSSTFRSCALRSFVSSCASLQKSRPTTCSCASTTGRSLPAWRPPFRCRPRSSILFSSTASVSLIPPSLPRRRSRAMPPFAPLSGRRCPNGCSSLRTTRPSSAATLLAPHSKRWTAGSTKTMKKRTRQHKQPRCSLRSRGGTEPRQSLVRPPFRPLCDSFPSLRPARNSLFSVCFSTSACALPRSLFYPLSGLPIVFFSARATFGIGFFCLVFFCLFQVPRWFLCPVILSFCDPPRRLFTYLLRFDQSRLLFFFFV